MKPNTQALLAALLDVGEPLVAGVVEREGGAELHLLPLDDHPMLVLAGFRAPADWTMVVIVADGHDKTDGDRCRVAVAVCENGRTESAIMRADATVQPMAEPPVGLVVDACRLVLRLPTHPPNDLSMPRPAWTELRLAVANGDLSLGGVAAEQAAWCDDGAFSRWVLRCEGASISTVAPRS